MVGPWRIKYNKLRSHIALGFKLPVNPIYFAMLEFNCLRRHFNSIWREDWMKEKRIILITLIVGLALFAIGETNAAGMGIASAPPVLFENGDLADGDDASSEESLNYPFILFQSEGPKLPQISTFRSVDQDPYVDHVCTKSGNDLEVTVMVLPLAYFSANDFYYTYSFSDGTEYELLHNEYYVQHTYTDLDYPLDVQVLVYEPNKPTPWFSHREQIDCSYTCDGDLCLNGEVSGKCCDHYCSIGEAYCMECPGGSYISCASFMDVCYETGTGTHICCEEGMAVCNSDNEGEVGCYDPGGEIEVMGNGIYIPNNDTTPSTADLTDFGSAVVAGSPMTHTFTIQNQGGDPLNLTGTGQRVTVTGENFSLYTDADPQVGCGYKTTTFVVVFSPDAIGTFTGTVSIANDDPNENPFTFQIQGTGEDPTAVGLESYSVRPEAFQIFEFMKILGGMTVLLALTMFGRSLIIRRKKWRL